jgi:predicted DNA-binding transcriptional regulator AlpA
MPALRKRPVMAKQEFEFTLILSGVAELTAEVLGAFFEAGCDDALIGTRDGIAYADFCREAGSYREAVLSAIADVESAGVGARVVRVEPDELVTMADIARRAGRSRESIRQLVAGLRGPGDFPPPVANLKQRSPIWRWTEVAQWLEQRQTGPTPPTPAKKGPEAEELAGADAWVAVLNGALEVRRHIQSADQVMELLRTLMQPRGRRRVKGGAVNSGVGSSESRDKNK